MVYYKLCLKLNVLEFQRPITISKVLGEISSSLWKNKITPSFMNIIWNKLITAWYKKQLISCVWIKNHTGYFSWMMERLPRKNKLCVITEQAISKQLKVLIFNYSNTHQLWKKEGAIALTSSLSLSLSISLSHIP